MLITCNTDCVNRSNVSNFEIDQRLLRTVTRTVNRLTLATNYHQNETVNVNRFRNVKFQKGI